MFERYKFVLKEIVQLPLFVGKSIYYISEQRDRNVDGYKLTYYPVRKYDRTGPL